MPMTITLEGPNVGRDSLDEAQRNEVEELVLAEGVVTVGTRAFRGLPQLRRVVIPSTVENWGSGAFRECPTLTEVIVKSQTIGERAFAQCIALNDITLKGTTTVGELAFAGCRPKVLESVKRQRRTNVLLAKFNEYAGRVEAYRSDYQAVCTRFDAIGDWRDANVLGELVYAQDNHIANLALANAQIPDVRAIDPNQLGDFLNRLSAGLRDGAEDARLADFQQEFFRMVPAGHHQPILIFTRHIAGAAHDRYVPVPRFSAMDACYRWMAAHDLIDERFGGGPGGDARENLLLWLRQSKAVHNALRTYLSDKSDAERGVFAWLLVNNQGLR